MPAKLPKPGKVVKVKVALLRGARCVAKSIPGGGGIALAEVAMGAELWFCLHGYKDDQVSIHGTCFVCTMRTLVLPSK
jgi:hypothetical protein